VKKPVILVDCDGPLADFVAAYLSLVHEHTGRLHTHEQVTNFSFQKCVVSAEEDDHVWKRMIDARPGLVRNLGETFGSAEGLHALRQLGCKVACLTSPHLGPHWMYERAQWLLERGFTKREIIFASDKSHVSGFILIDDNVDNCEAWAKANPHGVAILFEAPWNRGAKLRENVLHACDWNEVVFKVRNLVFAAFGDVA
jgi:5'(3')-deoxyribonucleotidase